MKHQVLLINPKVNQASQNIVINRIINNTFPTNIGVLAGVLLNSKITSPKIIDEQINPIQDRQLENIILTLPCPRIIGITVLTITSKRAHDLAEKIKRIDGSALIVLGGIHATVLPEEALSHKNVDVVVRGEGEATFKELISLVLKNEDFDDIFGISIRKNGKISHNPLRPLINNLDEIPPFPYHLFEQDKDKYASFGGVIASRGCPHGCIFCSSRSISGKNYRYFSIERIISEIKLLVYKYNQKTIWLMDDNIAANRRRFIELMDAIIKEKLPADVNFHGSMRADNVTDEVLDKIKAVNFKMLAFGMETGDESLMRLVNKGETVSQVVEAINKTSAKGIAAATTIIFGLPGETRRDRQETLKIVNSLPLSSVRFNILTPYPGTPVFDVFKDKGEILIKPDWANFAVQYMWEGDDLPYVPKGNNVHELIFDTMWANLSFYFSLSGIKRILLLSFAGGNVIKVTNKWYFSPKTIWNFVQVISYLSFRFLQVALVMVLDKARQNKDERYIGIKETILNLCNGKEKKFYSTSGEHKFIYDAYLKKVSENVLFERYCLRHRPLYTRLFFNYQKIPAWIRYYGQKFLKGNKPVKNVFPEWPIEKSLEELRAVALKEYRLPEPHQLKKISWPDNKTAAVILTHDIEAQNNWKWVKIIAEIEKESDFRSSWNVVPHFYKIDYALLDCLKSQGFEIGLHGYNHDNKLPFLEEAHIRDRMEASIPFINRYQVKGFRSPTWLRSEKLFRVLQDYLLYDCSILDIDLISPAGIGGACSIFPYYIDRLIEIPTTLPFEFPVQLGVKRKELNNFWQEKISWIKDSGGLLNVITHPDPYYGGNQEMVEAYRIFLEMLSKDKDFLHLLPQEAALLYKSQNSE